MNSPRLTMPGASILERVWQHGFSARPFVRYGFGIALAFAVSLFRIALNKLWGADFPFILYFPTTLFTALYGGIGPALVGIIVTSLMTVLWVFPPMGQLVLTQASQQGVIVYLVVDTLVAWIGSRHRRALKDRLEAKRQTQQQLDRMNALLDIVPVGIWTGNRDCSDIRGNPAAYRLMGFDAGVNASVTAPNQEIPRVRIFMNGKEVSPEDAPMQQVARTGKPIEKIEHEIVFQDGTRKSVYASIAPLLDESGQVREVIAAYSDFTDAKRARDHLRQSEERFRALVSIVTDVTWRTDVVGDYVTPQHSWERYTGQSWEEHRGSGWVNALHPEDRDRVAEIWRRACDTRTPYESRGRLWHAPSQSWHYYIGRALPLLNDDGSVREWVGCVADVHEQMRAEAALRESEQRFRTMADGAPVMIWLSGMDKLCTWFNQQWLEFTGRTMEQELGNGWAESVHKEDFDRCLKTYVEGFDARRAFTMEYRLRRHDGEWRWVLDHGVPVYKSGDFTGYIGSCIDITVQKQAEEALREREDQLAAIISRTPFMLTRCTRDLRYRFVSRAYAKMIGVTPQEVEGKLIAQIIGKKGYKTILPYIEKVLAGEPVEYERGVHFEGVGVRWLHVVYTPEADEEGIVQSWIASIVDVTDRKHAEQTLREALKAKDRFLASISHELRTPLTPVLLTADMLQQNTTLPQPIKDALDVIRRNVKLEAKLVNDLLDVSRASNGKFHLELSECDVHQIVQRAVRVCCGANDGNELNVTTRLTATHRNCSGDATRLQQVFWNLIQNAAKFTAPTGSITITSRNDNGHLCVEISDTGCGIEPAKLERIFEPFIGEEDAVSGSGRQRGFGLGLFIARQIVIAHGGTLIAASDGPNRGATFTVSLPASPEQEHLWR